MQVVSSSSQSAAVDAVLSSSVVKVSSSSSSHSAAVDAVLSSSHSAAVRSDTVDAATSSSQDIIELLDVKEEPQHCYHTDYDENGVRWPMKVEMPVMVTSWNQMPDPYRMTVTLDSVLMQYNMRGWSDMRKHMTDFGDKFTYFYSNTGAGNRGFMAVCKQCDRLCKIDWLKSDAWDAPILEECRIRLRHYFGFGSQGHKSGQRIV